MALKHFDGNRYKLLGYVVMDDHVHVLVRPLGDNTLEAIVHSWKSYTAHRMVTRFDRSAPVWQHEYFDRIVRDESELCEKLTYIMNNPFNRWPSIKGYAWAWCQGMNDTKEQ